MCLPVTFAAVTRYVVCYYFRPELYLLRCCGAATDSDCVARR